jgi:hypothetical protein
MTQFCDPCRLAFYVVRGSAFEDQRPFGLYLAALHGHSPGGKLAHLAVSVLDFGQPDAGPTAFAIEVSATRTEFRHTLVDWAGSPWARESYLGRMLNRTEALESPLKPLAFQVADRVLGDIPEVQAYFG